MFVAHGVATATPLPVRFAVAVLAGLGATALMNLPVNLLSYGNVPPRVAAAAIWREPVAEVSASESAAVHYASGMIAGALFESVVILTEGTVGTEPVLGGLTVAEIFAALLVAVFVFALFILIVFPHWGGRLYRDQNSRATVTRQWAVSVATFGVGLLVLVPVLYALLPVG